MRVIEYGNGDYKMTKNQILKELEGCEIWSLQFEDMVTVSKGKVYRHYLGDTITPTKAQARELFEEHFEAEFGTRNVYALLEKEFGLKL